MASNSRYEPGICELFEMQQEQTPWQTAVSFGGRSLTYSELNKRADHLSAQLRQTETDSLFVGISSTRDLEMIVGLLGYFESRKGLSTS